MLGGQGHVFDRAEPVLAGVGAQAIPIVWTVAPSFPGYVDREEYVQEIKTFAAVERDTAAVVALNARPGMGKTALLRRCAAAFRSHFDIALYVDFEPLRHDGAVNMGDILARALEDLYVSPQWIPTSLEGRLSRYLSLLDGRRALVLLDGATEAAQVLSLVPNSSSALVIAAGEVQLADLEADGALVRRLAGLTAPHGADLLTAVGAADRVRAAERAHVHRLVDLCGGSPQGLRIAGGRLRSEDLSVSELVTELEGELAAAMHSRGASGPDPSLGEGRIPMTDGLDAAYRALPSQAARAYRLLGVLPSREFPRRIAAAALDVSVRAMRPILARLVAVDLIEEISNGGYRMPDLIRIHAGRAAIAEEDPALLDESRRRVVGTWLGEAAAADREVNRERYRVGDDVAVLADSEVTGTGSTAAMRWFARWHDSLLAVLRQAAAQEISGAVWRLFEAMWPFYTTHSYLQAWEEGATLAVKAAERDGDPAAAARMLCFRSRPQLSRRNFSLAEQDLEAALRLADGVDDDGRLLASVLDFRGQCHYTQHRDVEALRDFAESLAINGRLGDRRGIALQSQFCGRALGRLGRADEALAALDRAATLIAEFDDARAASKVAFSRGEVLASAQRDAEAVESLHDAVALGAPLGASELITPPLERLVKLAHQHHDSTAERRYLERLVELHRAGGSPHVEQFQAQLDQLAP
jgi:tetratricopeptide (TPR) repeat protein